MIKTTCCVISSRFELSDLQFSRLKLLKKFNFGEKSNFFVLECGISSYLTSPEPIFEVGVAWFNPLQVIRSNGWMIAMLFVICLSLLLFVSPALSNFLALFLSVSSHILPVSALSRTVRFHLYSTCYFARWACPVADYWLAKNAAEISWAGEITREIERKRSKQRLDMPLGASLRLCHLCVESDSLHTPPSVCLRHTVASPRSLLSVLPSFPRFIVFFRPLSSSLSLTLSLPFNPYTSHTLPSVIIPNFMLIRENCRSIFASSESSCSPLSNEYEIAR